MKPRTSALALAIATCVSLTACGGGGSNVKPSPPPVSVPPPPAPPAPVPPPPPPAAPAVQATYAQAGVDKAWEKGFTGKGVIVGIYDTDPKDVPALEGKNLGKVDDGRPSQINGGDENHGTGVATLLLGKPDNLNRNGVAPDAKFYWMNRGSAANYTSMVERGVKIINISLTAGTAEVDTMTEDERLSIRRNWSLLGLEKAFLEAQTAGVLIIQAGGNYSKDSPSRDDVLPVIMPELNNYITVVALGIDGKTLASYSNKCGEKAKNFCLASPAQTTITHPADPTRSGTWAGTSFAAPVVSGIAAMVREAFPWMNAQQVRDTLLSTADDLGEAGVDTTYGHGRVNAGKAVMGIGMTQSSFAAEIPAGTTSVFGNNISGEGSITKTGGGTLILTGDNTYTGGTSVKDGTLALQGSLTGNLTQSGGSVYGAGKVSGDYAQDGGRLILDAGKGMDVAGKATVGKVDIGSGTYLGKSWSGELLRAGTLDADKIESGNGLIFYSQSVSANGNTISGSLNRTAGANSGVGDHSTLQALKGVDASLAAVDKAGTDAQKAALNPMAMMSRTEPANITLDSLSGQAHATARTMAMDTADIQYRWNMQRATEAASSEKGGAWAMAGGFDSKVRPADSFDADVKATAISAGADGRISDNLIAGASLNAGRTTSDFSRNGGKVETDSKGFTAYAAWHSGPNTVTGFFGQNSLRNQVQRNVVTGTVSQLHSNTRATATSAGLAFDRKITGNLSAGVTAQHDRVRSKAFQEQGTSGFELAALGSTAKRNQAGAYIKLTDGREFSTEGWHWDAALGYYRTIGDTDTGFNAAYANTSGATFHIDGAKFDKDSFWANFGVANRFGKNVIFVRGDVRSDDNGTAPGVSLGYRREF